MTSQNPHNPNQCPSSELSAYIDGELSPTEEERLEMHLRGCAVCRQELNEQKKFLFALNSSLEDEALLELPNNFAKVVVANAESQVSGLRGRRDRVTAVLICSALLLFALIALGSRAESVRSAGSVVEKLTAVGGFLLHFAYDAALGTIVVFKTLSAQLGSPLTIFAVVLLFALSLFAFSRLLFRDRRTQEN